MKFLAFDTSAKRLVVAAGGGAREAVRVVESPMQHSVRLMGEIDLALKEAGFSVAECDLIACVVGPGSFTGIRIGISALKGLCFSGKRALGVTSFQEIAYADKTPAKISAVDAGHGFLYAEGFGVSLPQGYYPKEEVLSLSAKTGAPILAAEPCGAGERLVSPAEGLVAFVRRNAANAVPAREIAALYLRKSSAEEGR